MNREVAGKDPGNSRRASPFLKLDDEEEY